MARAVNTIGVTREKDPENAVILNLILRTGGGYISFAFDSSSFTLLSRQKSHNQLRSYGFFLQVSNVLLQRP
jgi:hypothetical protein